MQFSIKLQITQVLFPRAQVVLLEFAPTATHINGLIYQMSSDDFSRLEETSQYSIVPGDFIVFDNELQLTHISRHGEWDGRIPFEFTGDYQPEPNF